MIFGNTPYFFEICIEYRRKCLFRILFYREATAFLRTGFRKCADRDITVGLNKTGGQGCVFRNLIFLCEEMKGCAVVPDRILSGWNKFGDIRNDPVDQRRICSEPVFSML